METVSVFKIWGLYLFSSESGFHLLTLIEVLQADLPQSCQIFLRTSRQTLNMAYWTNLHRRKHGIGYSIVIQICKKKKHSARKKKKKYRFMFQFKAISSITKLRIGIAWLFNMGQQYNQQTKTMVYPVENDNSPYWAGRQINSGTAHTGQRNIKYCERGGGGAAGWITGVTQAQLKGRWTKPNVMGELVGEAGLSGFGSYLLLFVGFGSPAPYQTNPGSIDCCEVLPSSLFTVQFNHTLEGHSP